MGLGPGGHIVRMSHNVNYGNGIPCINNGLALQRKPYAKSVAVRLGFALDYDTGCRVCAIALNVDLDVDSAAL